MKGKNMRQLQKKAQINNALEKIQEAISILNEFGLLKETDELSIIYNEIDLANRT